MSADQRLKGQEVSIRVVVDAVTEATLDIISTFNSAVLLRLLEQGYLGELVNRFDEILDGYGGDFEANVAKALWNNIETSIIDRAQRKVPGTVFNIVRTDLFSNGDSTVYVYGDVNWAEIPTAIAGRGDYVKVKFSFKCSERTVKNNALP